MVPSRTESSPPAATVTGVDRLRWWIVWTLFGSTVINYINRQTLSVLAPVISKEFHLNHAQLSNIFGAFQLSYAGTWLLGGIFLDIIGTRLGLSIAVVWWSIVSVATSFAHSAFSLSVFRFLLGIGEGLNWPGASKAVAEFFPPQERSLAVAIFDSGSSVGGAIAAVTIPALALAFGWRSAFVASGLLGFIWLAVWLAVYRRRPAPSGQTGQQPHRRWDSRTWLHTLRQRKTWAVVIGRGLTDPIWWFYVFWLPQYLSDTRGFSLKQIAAFSWIPFVAADAGNFTGGYASGQLIKRGVPVMSARKIVCVISCIPLLAGIPAAMVDNAVWSIFFICVALLGYASWSTIGLTLPSDLFQPEVVGSVTGLSGFCAGLMSTIFTVFVGTLVDHFSYLPAFVIAAVVPIVATLSVVFLIRKSDYPPSDFIQHASVPDSA
jgi:ACS family hexuronate transporter-like MFS transporter